MPRAGAPSRRGGSDGAIRGHTVGNALVLHGRDRISAQAQSLAMAVAKDSEHDFVVLDMPGQLPMHTWESVASALPRRRRSGIRLVICGDHPEPPSLVGQWLSERLNRPVVTPHGRLTRSAAGSLFVHSGPGTGWIRYRPRREPKWEGKRFPRPIWDQTVADDASTSSTGVAEPVPGGVWIHDTTDEGVIKPHRQWLLSMVPCQPDDLVVVLGCPGTRALPLDDVYRFYRKLDDDTRQRTRFVGFGPVDVPGADSLGQALADALANVVVCYTGVPVGSPSQPLMFTVDVEGRLCWQTFAEELAYAPRERPAAPPRTPYVVSHRSPLELGEQIEPGVYWYADDAVIEVLQSGLWVRPSELPRDAELIRAAHADAERHTLVFDDANERRAARMRTLAEDVAGQLDPATRARTELVPASMLVGAAARGPAPAGGWISQDRAGQAGIEPAATVAAPTPAATPIDWQTTAAMPAVPPVAAPTAATVPVAPEPIGMGEPVAVRKPAEPLVVTEPVAAVEPAAAQEAVDLQLPAAGFEPAPVREAVAGPEPAWEPGVPAQPLSVPPAPTTPLIATPAVPPPVAPPTALTAPTGAAAPTVPPAAAPTVPPAGERSPVVVAAATDRVKPVGGPRLQPVPQRAAAALPPDRGLTEERAWLRRSLSRDYDAVASMVSRVLSEQPGMHGGNGASADEVMTDAVAVRLYLSRPGGSIDSGLRSARKGPHVPLARCAFSGLSRLPSHRGATVFPVTPTTDQWRLLAGRSMLTEWGFLNALATPSPDLGGDTDVLIWSMTARRTKLLEPDGDDHVDSRLLFLPGTSFKVLSLAEPGAGRRGELLLREVAANEIDPDGRVQNNWASLDELAATALRRCLEHWSEVTPSTRVGSAARPRFAAVPGLAEIEEGDR